MKEISLDTLWDDSGERERKTKRHEAGHAAAAWLVQGNITRPPFEYIEIGTMAQQAGGVVPGGVKYDAVWFETLSPVDQGAILLAGLYLQDGESAHSAQSWRELLDQVEGTNGVDDYARAMEVRDHAQSQHSFDEAVRQRLISLPGLSQLVDVIESTLKPGGITSAVTIVEALQHAVSAAAARSK